MTPSPKKWSFPHLHHRPKELFVAVFSENVAFLENIVRWKNIRNLILRKKSYIHFRRRRRLPFKKGLAPKIVFHFFS